MLIVLKGNARGFFIFLSSFAQFFSVKWKNFVINSTWLKFEKIQAKLKKQPLLDFYWTIFNKISYRLPRETNYFLLHYSTKCTRNDFFLFGEKIMLFFSRCLHFCVFDDTTQSLSRHPLKTVFWFLFDNI